MGHTKKQGALNMINKVLGKSPLPQAVPIPPELIIGETGFAKAEKGEFFDPPKTLLGKAGEKLAKNKIISKIKAKAAAKKNEKFMNQSQADFNKYVRKQFEKIDNKNQASSSPTTPAGVSDNEPNYESPTPEIPEGMGEQSVNQWHKNKREWTDIGVSGIPGVPSIRKQK
tara:strand:- start:617 stop:1126 length:510 start_codon:yes stop_codon:yes gene_type:complete